MIAEVQMERDTVASCPKKVDYDFPLATDGTHGNPSGVSNKTVKARVCQPITGTVRRPVPLTIG